MATEMNRIYLFNNALLNESWMSGTDKRSAEWTRVWRAAGREVVVYAPALGRQRYEDLGARFVCTDDGPLPRSDVQVLMTYVRRAVRTARMACNLPPGSIIYSSSDALPDVIPAARFKKLNPDCAWMTGLHLIAPNPFKGFEKATTKGYRLPTIKGLYYYVYQLVAIRLMKQHADLVMVSNETDRSFVIRCFGMRPSQVTAVYGGVNFDEVQAATPGAKWFDACFIGRVHPQKGLDDLLRIWRLVVDRYSDARLALIGRLEPLRKQVEEMGLSSSVEFMGYVDGIEKFSLLKASRLFLLPSHYEGCAIVGAEAMACGLPVVAYDIPMLREVYPRGLVIVPPWDVELFSEQVIHLLDNESDRRQWATAALEMSLSFRWDRTAQRIIQRALRAS